MLTLALLAAAAAPPAGAFSLEWDRHDIGARPRFLLGVIDFDSGSLDLNTDHFEVHSIATHPDGTFQIDASLGAGKAFRVGGWVDGDTLRGGGRWEDWPLQPVAGTRLDSAPLDGSQPSGFPTVTPEEAGLEPAAVAALVRASIASHSSGLVVLKDGAIVIHRTALPGQHNIQSISKPLASLAVPFLLADGHIASLDAPLGPVIEAWTDDDPRGAITLRHVLTHTTGLAYEPDARKVINDHPDKAALVLGSALEHEPGTTYGYSNRAMGLLPIVVQATTGQPLDTYVTERVLEPLGIQPRWPRDGAGNPTAYGGIGLTALELARLGQLLLEDGRHAGGRVLPRGWVATSTTPSPLDVEGPDLGVSWFLDEETGSFGHTGSGGQYLQVYPKHGLVLARVHRWHDAEHHAGRSVYRAMKDLLPR